MSHRNLKIALLASGSSGNCILVDSGSARILVDAGISCKRIEGGLISLGVDPASIDAIFITHEHTDHISGLEVFQKRYHRKIFATAGTMKAVEETSKISTHCEVNIVAQQSETFFGDTSVTTFMTDHDAAEPFGVEINFPGRKVCVATDLGYVNKAVFDHMKNSNVIILESNYDEKMLVNGSYPWYLKKRIMGKRGHLSNRDSSEALVGLNWEGLSDVFLAHISRENNTHDIVYDNALKAFSGEPCSPAIHLTYHDRMSECIRD